MSLETLIKATGLRRAALDYDMRAAINRWKFSHNPEELTFLHTDQVLLLILATNPAPENPIWAYAEQRLGHPIPRNTVNG